MGIIGELKKPSTAVGVLITAGSILLSIPIAIGINLWMAENPEPLYEVHDTTQIYDASKPSPNLRLLDVDGELIEESVFAAEVSFWNEGSVPIERSDVRRDVRIQLLGAEKLIDYYVVAETDTEVTRFELAGRQGDAHSSPSIELQWMHLDPGLGARIQIIYSGEREADLFVDGHISSGPFKRTLDYSSS